MRQDVFSLAVNMSLTMRAHSDHYTLARLDLPISRAAKLYAEMIQYYCGLTPYAYHISLTFGAWQFSAFVKYT